MLQATPTSELQPLPPMRQVAPEIPQTRTATTACQGVAWNVLVAEAVATERTRMQALQAELKALRAHIKEREEAATAAEESVASHLDARNALAAELEVAQRLVEETRAAHRKEQEAWEEERKSW